MLLLLIFIPLASTQGQTIRINYDIDTATYNVGAPLQLWMNFLEAGDDSISSKYWSAAEVEKYGRDSYFLIERELNFGTKNYLKLMNYATVTILSIRKLGDYYKINSLMEFPGKDSITSNIQYIYNVYAGEENGELKLFNPLKINTDINLNSTTVGFIRFHYLKTHTFDEVLAKKQNDFLVDFAKHFEVPTDTIDYYFAPTREELAQIRGFDFIIGINGEEIPSGRADATGRIVYSSGLAEYYPHEFIHILLYPHYPNGHWWIHEGVATYFGLSRGKELNWQLERLNRHLAKHPEINLDTMLQYRTVDQFTDYSYALGGWVVQKAYEKGGYGLVKKLLNSGKTSEDFYAAIEEHLGIKQEGLDETIKAELKVTFGD